MSENKTLSEKERLHIENLLDIARKLCAGSECIMMGSMALYLEFPEVLDYVPGDVDLLADAGIENLRKIIRILRVDGFKVFSWQDEIDELVSTELLKGRFYIRGIKEMEESAVTVDVTYEIVAVDWQQVKDSYVEIEGNRVFEKDVLIKILRGCPKEKKQEQARRLEELNINNIYKEY